MENTGIRPAFSISNENKLLARRKQQRGFLQAEFFSDE